MHKEERNFGKGKKRKTSSKFSRKSDTKKRKIVQIQVLLPSIRIHERISRTEKTLQKALLMPSLRDGNAIETLLMTAQINTDFVNQPVPSTTEPSTSLRRVELMHVDR
ncbi:uncharacterized protein TNCV_1286281 [Trichonephila clavipes]|uniref:Uncharacterized protein n=1 Tax=Trichonephila clavipes TaxID=2585209 RepID=A0A8X6VPA2_TRICX|nr:uncharacterized protein TNCV_1388341 [Trichonephila clavipes]GFY15983.1 uncharacterized protein TNCV_1286281 [Trichonephila clavipes]